MVEAPGYLDKVELEQLHASLPEIIKGFVEKVASSLHHGEALDAAQQGLELLDEIPNKFECVASFYIAVSQAIIAGVKDSPEKLAVVLTIMQRNHELARLKAINLVADDILKGFGINPKK